MPLRTLPVLLLYILYVSYGLTAAGVEARGGRGRGRGKARPHRPDAARSESPNRGGDGATNDVRRALVFSRDIYEGEVMEDAPIGSLVLTISASETRNGNYHQTLLLT